MQNCAIKSTCILFRSPSPCLLTTFAVAALKNVSDIRIHEPQHACNRTQPQLAFQHSRHRCSRSLPRLCGFMTAASRVTEALQLWYFYWTVQTGGIEIATGSVCYNHARPGGAPDQRSVTRNPRNNSMFTALWPDPGEPQTLQFMQRPKAQVLQVFGCRPGRIQPLPYASASHRYHRRG